MALLRSDATFNDALQPFGSYRNTCSAAKISSFFVDRSRGNEAAADICVCVNMC